MAIPSGSEKGVTSSLKMRAGIDLPELLGKVTENDGGAIPFGAQQEAINIEFSGAGLASRPGLSKSNEDSIDGTGCVEMITDIYDVGAPTESAFGPCIVLLEDEGDSGDPTKIRVFADTNTPTKLLTFTLSEVPATGIAYRSAIFSRNFQAVIAGSGVDGSFVSRLVRITLSDPPKASVETSVNGAGDSNETGFTGLAADGEGTPGVIHAALGVGSSGAANMKIFTWDPDDAETDPVAIDTGMGLPRGEIILGYFEDELVAAWSTNNANRIRIGDGITAGSDEVMPDTLFNGLCMTMFDGALRILGYKGASGGGQCITYNGDDPLAVSFTIAAQARITHAVEFNGLLVFVWSAPSEANAWIGTWDGTTVNDTVFDLTSLDDVDGDLCRGLYVYNGRLVVVMPMASGTERGIFSSDGTDLTSWTQEGANIAAPVDVGCVVGDDAAGQHLVVANGEQHIRVHGQTEFGDAVGLPAGVRLKAARPWPIDVRRGSILLKIVVGRYSPGLVWVDGDPWLLGIEGPSAAPTIAAQGTGLTGSTIGYISFVHKIMFRGTSITVHESNLSTGSNSLTLTNQGVRWTLPTTHTNERVTHVRLYRTPADGSSLFPRFIADVALGTTTYDEATADATVQVAFTPALVRDAEGNYDVDFDARGVPPYCQIAAAYNYRTWWARDPNYPARLWHSRQNEPEAVNLETGYEETPCGDAITALATTENELIVFTALRAYAVEDNGGTDIRWRHIVRGKGCIGPYTPRSIGGGMIVFLASDGPTLYPSWRNLIHKSRRSEFETKYLANPKGFQNAFGFNHSLKGSYELLVNYDTAPKSRSWCWYYHPMVAEGKEPDWYWYDRILDRRVYTIGELFDPGLMRPVTYYGSCDGYLRVEDATDADDDGDTYLKTMNITPRHEFMGDQGGNDDHGYMFESVDLFLQNEDTDVTLGVFLGDEGALGAASPVKTLTIKAGEQVRAGNTAVARSSLRRTINKAGKGITARLTAPSPVGVNYRGYVITFSRTGGQGRSLT